MKLFKIIAYVFSIAYEIFGTLIIGVFLGILVDRIFHTKAIFTIVFSILGMIQAFRAMMKLGE